MSESTVAVQHDRRHREGHRGPRYVARRFAVRLAIALVAVAVALVAVEVAARVILNADGMNYGIEMWKYARDLKRPSADPQIGHEHVPDSEAVIMGQHVRIDSHGFRGPGVSLLKPQGTFRILALGDSMTFGFGAPEESVWPRALEERLNSARSAGEPPRFEVINAGVGNYNTTQEFAFFRQRGVQFDPDMVILGFYINDAEPLPNGNPGFLDRHSYAKVLLGHGGDAIAREMELRPGFEAYYRGLYDEHAVGWKDCRAALSGLADLCGDRGVPLVVVLIPELHAPGAAYPFRDIHENVAGLLRTRGVQVVDLCDALESDDPLSLWISPGDAHPNAECHRRIAHRVFDELASRLPREGRSAARATAATVSKPE